MLRRLKEFLYSLKCDARNLLKYGTVDMFNGVNIETTTNCNLRCSYCPKSKFEKPVEYMDVGLFRKIIDDLAGIGYTGGVTPALYGEPLLDDRLDEFIRYINLKLPESPVVLYTNGVFLDLKRYRELDKLRLNRIVVTDHGVGVNMDEILDYRKAHPSSMKFFFKSILKEEMCNRGGLVDVEVVPKDSCDTPSSQFTIRTNGDVVLCCDDFNNSVVFGNVGESSVMEIYRSDKYRVLRGKLRCGVVELDACRLCLGK